MKIMLAAAALATTFAVASAASAAPARPDGYRQCFYTRSVNGFAPQGENVVNVRVGVRDVYRFELMVPCPDVRWNEQIALVSRGTDWICSGLDAEIVTRTPIGPRRCPVSNLHKLTPAEIAALPKGAKP